MEQALWNNFLGITLDDMMIPDLDFADNICLIDDNGNDRQKLIDNVTNKASRVGLQLNDVKTKFCSKEEYQKFYVYGKELECVDEFTYLRSNTMLPDSLDHKKRQMKWLGHVYAWNHLIFPTQYSSLREARIGKDLLEKNEKTGEQLSETIWNKQASQAVIEELRKVMVSIGGFNCSSNA